MSKAKCPDALQKAIASGDLVVFCGAGISKLPPSDLPDWWEFNTLLLEATKGLTLEGLRELPEATRQRLGKLSLEDIPVQTFSEILVTTFAGPSYFPVLKVLESTRPNANHFALAEMARCGMLRAIVSTNFDTLIERAFRAQEQPLRVFSSDEDIRDAIGNPGVCALYKIHGTIHEATSLVDTVQQKLRGLPLTVHKTLQHLFEAYHVLVIGYSGTDLTFGEDYLALHSLSSSSPGITWVQFLGSKPRAEVVAIIKEAGSRGSIVHGELPDFFTELGIHLENIPVDSNSGSINAPDARRAIESFFEQAHAGFWGSAAFCFQLLSQIGEEPHADALIAALDSHPYLSDEPQSLINFLATGAIIRVLATHAIGRAEADRGERWCKRELAIFNLLEKFYRDEGAEVPREAVKELARNRAGVWINLAMVALLRNDPAEAEEAISQSEKFSRESESYDLLARARFQQAQIAYNHDESVERILRLLHTADAFARDAGEGSVRMETLLLKSRCLISIAEYDSALAALDQAESLSDLVGGLTGKLRIAALRASVAGRRGKKEEVELHLKETLKEVSARGASTSSLKTLLGVIVPDTVSPFLYQTVRRVIEDLVEPGRAKLPDEIHRRAESFLGLGKTECPADVPVGLRLGGMNREETALRLTLAKLELENTAATTIAVLFEQLCKLAYRKGQPTRLLDLAKAYRQASDRCDSPKDISYAWHQQAIAYDLLGDLDRSLDAYQASIEAHPEKSPEDRAKVFANMALAKARRDDPDAEVTLRNAIRDLEEYNLETDALRFELNLAEYLGQHCLPNAGLKILENVSERWPKILGPEAIGARKRWQVLHALLSYRKRRMDERPHLHGTDSLILLARPAEATGLSLEEVRLLRKQARHTEDLANVGIVALNSRHFQEARSILEESRERYARDGNLLGISRSLNNLAAVVANQGYFDQAIEWRKQALRIRRDLGDLEGEALTLSELAQLCLTAEDIPGAIDNAQQSILLLTQESGPHKARALALGVLAFASAKQNLPFEAGAAAQEFLRESQLLKLPWMERWRRPLEAFVGSQSVTASRRSQEDWQQQAAEAHRLSKIGLVDHAIETLDALLESSVDPDVRAIVLGNKGHALQNANRLEEALVSYLEAGQRFADIGDNDHWVEAVRQAAICLRRLGRIEEAESLLNEMLEKIPPSAARGLLLRTLAATIQHRLDPGIVIETVRSAGGIEYSVADSDRLAEPAVVARRREYGEEASRLLAEALEMPGLNDGQRGSDMLSLAWILYDPLERLAEAADLARSARPYLLRANSPAIEICDQLLERVEQLHHAPK